MVGEQTQTHEERVEQLRPLTKTDPDPRVRRWAHGVLLGEQGHPLAEVARFFGTAPHRVRAWQDHVVARGRAGLADQARGGRPRSWMRPRSPSFLSAALAGGPQACVWLSGDRLDAARSRAADAAAAGAGGAGQSGHALSGGADAGLLLSPAAPTLPGSDPPAARRRRGGSPTAPGVAAPKKAAAPRRLHLLALDACAGHTHPDLATVWRKQSKGVR
jgi:hypothetical protein